MADTILIKKSKPLIARHLIYTVLLLAVTTALCYVLFQLIPDGSIVIMVYLLGVFLISRLTDGYWYGVFGALMAVFLYDYLFTEPYFSLDTQKPADYVIFSIMLAVSLITSATMTRIRRSVTKQIRQAGIQAKNSQILENEKLRGTILRSISHDLRTPLTSITGSVSMLLDKGSEMPEADRTRLLQDVYQESSWLNQFVENLLSLTRIDDKLMRLRIKPELVEEVVGETLVIIRHRLGSRKLEVGTPPEPTTVWLDSALIEQVLINLLDNAIAHTPLDGSITLTVTADRKQVRFNVWNSGPSIAPDVLDKIFDRYFVGNEERFDSRRGMGLGLSICQAIVLAHQGQLTAENCPTGGVSFSFTLPTHRMTDLK